MGLLEKAAQLVVIVHATAVRSKPAAVSPTTLQPSAYMFFLTLPLSCLPAASWTQAQPSYNTCE